MINREINSGNTIFIFLSLDMWMVKSRCDADSSETITMIMSLPDDFSVWLISHTHTLSGKTCNCFSSLEMNWCDYLKCWYFVISKVVIFVKLATTELKEGREKVCVCGSIYKAREARFFRTGELKEKCLFSEGIKRCADLTDNHSCFFTNDTFATTLLLQLQR